MQLGGQAGGAICPVSWLPQQSSGSSIQPYSSSPPPSGTNLPSSHHIFCSCQSEHQLLHLPTRFFMQHSVKNSKLEHTDTKLSWGHMAPISISHNLFLNYCYKWVKVWINDKGHSSSHKLWEMHVFKTLFSQNWILFKSLQRITLSVNHTFFS